MSAAFRVGLLVIAFFVLIIVAYTFLGIHFFGPKQNTYYAKLSNSGSVTEGNRITLLGIKVGQVRSVKLEDAHYVLMTLAIDHNIHIPEGSILKIKSQLVGLGEPEVMIEPSEKNQATLPPGSFLKTEESSAYSSILPGADQVLSELTKTLAAARSIFENPLLQEQMISILGAAQNAAKQFSHLAEDLDAHLDVTAADFHLAATKLMPTLNHLATISSSISKLAKEGEFTKVFQEVEHLMVTSRSMVQELKSTLSSPKIKTPLENSLQNVDQITETGKKIASNAELISKNGIVFSDKAIEVVEKASKLEDDAKTLLKKFNSTFDQFLGKTKLGKIETHADVVYQTKKNKKLRSDVGFIIPFGGQKYQLGLYSAFEKNRLILQKIEPLGQNADLRYGVYAAKPGIGVDLTLSPGLYLSSDLYGLNKLHLNMHTEISVKDGFTLWAELNDIFRQNVPGFGIGYRK